LTNGRWLATTLLLLFAALGIGMTLVLVGIHTAIAPGFLQMLTTPYGQVQDYAFDLEHADCAILIYGDSSSMTADDPVTIEAQTHLKTCNISQTQPVVSTTGTLPIDLYLKHNRPPKYLVIQVSPEVFYKPHGLDKNGAFDPMTMMLRHHSGFETTRELMQYPIQTLRYVSLVLQDQYVPNRKHLADFRKIYGGVIEDYYATRGFLTLPMPVQTDCGRPEFPGVPADYGWLEEARRRYESMGVKVLVKLSPVPDCDPRVDVYRAGIAAHVDGGVTTMPLSFFNDSLRHFTKDGAKVVSVDLANEIKEMERESVTARR
jgi:hypothetical protein